MRKIVIGLVALALGATTAFLYCGGQTETVPVTTTSVEVPVGEPPAQGATPPGATQQPAASPLEQAQPAVTNQTFAKPPNYKIPQPPCTTCPPDMPPPRENLQP